MSSISIDKDELNNISILGIEIENNYALLSLKPLKANFAKNRLDVA